MSLITRRRYRLVARGPVRLRWHLRSLLFVGVTLAVTAAAAVLALSFGDYGLSFSETCRALVGTGGDPLAQYFVQDIRLPRVAAAVLVGACLGASGAIFQALTRNPLGSPDITGFTVGAAFGAVVQILLFNGGPLAVGLGALVGGAVTGGLVFRLSRAGGSQGTTFVLVGLGVSFTLQALLSLLLVKAELSAAQEAAHWLAGSFNAVSWPQVVFLSAALAVLAPAVALFSRELSVLVLGDEISAGLGVEIVTRRRQLLLLGVALCAVSVAVAGPIGFVALAAPQVARRVAASPGAAVGSAAVLGGALVLVSDVVAQRVIAPVELPVGVVTGVVGGVYLLWILFREWKGR
ncbi:FecCD family ABC transporter permease [Corynebacterium frankenforstense]